MPTFHFDDAELAGLVRLLKETIAADHFPLLPQVRPLKRNFDKLDPTPAAEPFPAPRLSDGRAPQRSGVDDRVQGEKVPKPGSTSINLAFRETLNLSLMGQGS